MGFIFGIRKSLSEKEIVEATKKILELNWSKAVGIDFFQEEDRYGSL